MNDLERSDSYYRKICMLEHGYLPKQTEIKKRLGNQLSKVFFESCLPALKPYLGLCPALGGPEGDLWVSPSDLLLGIVKLKPPLTRKHIQALTHQGILEIGEEVEKKFIQEFEDEKNRALAENEEMMRYLAEKEKKEALNKLREEEEIKRELMAEKMREDFKTQLEQELKDLEEYLEQQKIIAVQEGKRETERIMQEKLELAVQETVTRLTRQFALELIKQSQCLHEHFWYHIKQEKKKLKQALDDKRVECEDQLKKLHSELQCENIANIMYILAQERRRCTCEKLQLEQNFLARLLELEKELDDKADNLKKTTSEMERLGHQVEAREQAMFELIKQFQKFIYFVLKAVPTQAEYLLSVEKLMIFEFTNTIMETKPQFFKEGMRLSSISMPRKSRPSRPSWPTEPRPASQMSGQSRPSTQSKQSTRQSLVYPAVHRCENEIKYIPSAVTLTSQQDLPGFVYNEKLYVREDFRNMISQGLKISRSNELWNFGLQELQSDTSISCGDNIRPSSKSSERKGPEKINVRFSQQTPEILYDEKVLKTTSFTTSPRRDSYDADIRIPSVSISPILSGTSLSSDEIRMPSKLSLARDSIELAKERSNLTLAKKEEVVDSVSKTSESKVARLDSKLLAIKKSYESKVESTKEVMGRGKDSKLELAVDSLTLMKSSATLRSMSQSFQCKTLKRSSVTMRKLADKATQFELMPKAKVAVSHIEIISDKINTVSFHDKANVIPPEKEIEPIIPCEKLPRKWICPEDMYRKKCSVEVLGDRESTAHSEYQDEFVAKRVNSFITIFRNNPSLRRLFTEVKNK